MNIWSWVHDTVRALRSEGTPEARRLATLIREVPGYVTDDAHAKLDAALPEALALAKAAKLPWVELFFRHWELQSRILKRFEGESALGDAVALVDFAHGDAAQGCPQAVCTVQDLGVAYGIVDGPGYAEERRAVAGETLARIDATWPCFTCISGEYASALVDGGDPRGAIAFLDAQEAKLAAAGKTASGTNLWGDWMQAHLDLGEPEEALAALDRFADDHEEDEVRYMLARARVLAELGRAEEAKKALPPFEKIKATPAYYERWAETMLCLVGAVDREHAVQNTSDLGRILEGFCATLEGHGAFRVAFETTAIHARLAAERQSPSALRQAIRRLERLVKKLRPLPVLAATHPRALPRDPEGRLSEFRATLEALQTKLQHAWNEEVPADQRNGEALWQQITTRDETAGGWLSADARLTFLEGAVAATAGEAGAALLRSLGEAYLRAGLLDDARAVLEPHAVASVRPNEVRGTAEAEYRASVRPNEVRGTANAEYRASVRPNEEYQALTFVYAAVLRAQADRAANDALVAALLADPARATDGHFLRGVYAHEQAERARGKRERERPLREARDAFDAVIALDPSVANTRRLAAQAAIGLGDYAGALAYYEGIPTRGRNDEWERILLATRLGRWAVVRDAAKTLELPVDPPESGDENEPIDEAWSYCRLRLDAEFDSEVAGGPTSADASEDPPSDFETFALRTGPATARCLVIAAPDAPQFFQATFLLRPEPLDGEGTDEAPYVYPALTILERRDYVYFTIDGVAPAAGEDGTPSADAWGALRRAVAAAGGEIQRHSTADYRVRVEGAEVPGVFATLAVPAASDVAAFHRLFTEHPAASGLVWLGLAAAAGDDAAVERQAARAEALGLAD